MEQQAARRPPATPIALIATYSNPSAIGRSAWIDRSDGSRAPQAHLMANRDSLIGGARCTVLLGLSSPTDVRDSRHVTEPSERVGPGPSAIGYVAMGWIAAF